MPPSSSDKLGPCLFDLTEQAKSFHRGQFRRGVPIGVLGGLFVALGVSDLVARRVLGQGFTPWDWWVDLAPLLFGAVSLFWSWNLVQTGATLLRVDDSGVSLRYPGRSRVRVLPWSSKRFSLDLQRIVAPGGLRQYLEVTPTLGWPTSLLTQEAGEAILDFARRRGLRISGLSDANSALSLVSIRAA